METQSLVSVVKTATLPLILRKLNSIYGFLLIFAIIFPYYYYWYLENGSPFLNLKHLVGEISSLQEQVCRIPVLDPFSPAVVKLGAKSTKLQNCHAHVKYTLLFNSSQKPYPRLVPVQNLEYIKKFGVQDCFYQKLVRGSGNFADSVSSHREPEQFPVYLDRETQIPTNHEFIVVSCNIGKVSSVSALNKSDTLVGVAPKIIDMHAFVHEKPIKLTTTSQKGENSKFNVIIVGIDSVSRMGFIRNYPNAYKYLMEDLAAVEMTGYNKIGDNTFPNIVPMLTNLPTIDESSVACENKKFFDACPFIWKKFEEIGYATLYAEDESTLGLLNLHKRGFSNPPTTYYLRPFLTGANELIGHQKDKLTNFCYGPRPAIQVMLDYMQKTSYAMHHGSTKRNYFQFAWSSSLTHDSINSGPKLDEIVENSLKWWKQGGYLNDTVFILMSDHGVRWGELRSYHQGLMEDRLPFMYIVTPVQFQRKYPAAFQNMVENRNRLITAVDLHETLVHILNLANYSEPQPPTSRSQSLFMELNTGISLFRPIPANRTCKMAGISHAYCTCNYQMNSLSVTDKRVINATYYALNSINEKLEEFKKCAVLKLERILHATQVHFEENVKNANKWVEYQITFQTMPGNGTFEAFVYWNWLEDEKDWGVEGRIGRTSFYGNQSHCVNDKKIKLYCFCLDLL